MLRALSHPAVVAFGLANLYLLALTGPLISPSHDLVYHLIGSAWPVFLVILVYVVALSLLLTSALVLAQRPGRLRVVVWSGFLLAIPSVVLHIIAAFTDFDPPDWISEAVALVALLLLLVVTFFWKRFLPRFERVQPGAAVILGVFAFSGLIIFGQLLWFAVGARNLNPAPSLHSAQHSAATVPHQRIIWLLLDELSYQQIYERRFPGLELPAFDQLAAESTVFTHAVPAGEYTRNIIPTLFTGLPSDEIKVSSRGLLVSMHDPATDRWTRFQQHQTVFQDALDAGYSTGIAGWYNPYCRIMPEVLDYCFWTYRESTPANLSPNRSFAIDLVRPFRYLLLDVQHLLGHGPGAPTDESRDIRQHSTDYRKLVAAGDSYLNNPSIDFLFLHMPIPHPFGFYDREQRKIASRHTSYIDNLALADLYLGHVRQVLEQQHEWNSTTFVVMGDHSWRTKLIWVDSSSWTEEDQVASHNGEFDDRPAYIVKLPDQHAAARIDRPYDAIHTRALFDALLQDRIMKVEDLNRWVESQK